MLIPVEHEIRWLKVLVQIEQNRMATQHAQ